ncbi:hypothetical protein K458DRAFT_397586 [Lentithecium fluviatile CBS 122367]|uniref:Uncharacterized protein n=1 Tax=Lentithecium fluviatile CBS 122367 TaxID=1168545 RepID=A0A6G1IC80_9PLEO|nr:hypothetical protein K458DRAFT_397586 [Lentithecium fluviatile CBS 122367]
MSIFLELGLSAAFTLISLAPSVPKWLKKNNGPKIRVNVFTGLPVVNGTDEKEAIYEHMSFGGCTPHISLFNANGDRIAKYTNWNCNSKIDQNVPSDLWADYINGKDLEKAEYITVLASGNDAMMGKMFRWSYSSATVQFKGPDGKTQDARPRCLWIDKNERDGNLMATDFEGFQVHLPDFKIDNSKFRKWNNQTGQMCQGLSRFTMYHDMNPMMFSDMTAQELYIMYGAEDPREIGGARREKRQSQFIQERFLNIQKRFSGSLIKSRDLGQSAVQVCRDKNSMGTDFFSVHEGFVI